MSIQIASLNSGSNGNCYYIGNQTEAVLVDCGLSCRETENRMTRAGLSMDRVRAIFISHEHSDHTGGTEVISKRYQVPVYLTKGTWTNCRLNLDDRLVGILKPYQEVAIGNLRVNPFPKRHDAAEPVSFTVAGEGVTIGILTDIGSVCEHVIRNFNRCDAAFLEANYDDVMLEEGSYPVFLKERIRSDHGHLSNRQALELFSRHSSPRLSHLLLSHLSRDNNNPRLVLDMFERHAGSTLVTVASRYEETAVYTILQSALEPLPVAMPTLNAEAVQMKLF